MTPTHIALWRVGYRKGVLCYISIMGNLLSRDIVERTDLVLSAAKKVNPQNAIKIFSLARRMLARAQRRNNRAVKSLKNDHLKNSIFQSNGNRWGSVGPQWGPVGLIMYEKN